MTWQTWNKFSYHNRGTCDQKFYIYCKICCYILNVTVNEFRNRPGVAQGVPGVLGSQISWHLACEGGEVSLTHRPPLPPGMFLVLIFTRGWVDPRDMVSSEGNMSLKNPVTPPGIDPVTVRLLAQRLNHYATPSPCCILRTHKSFLTVVRCKC
jgi:hypothetical protein